MGLSFPRPRESFECSYGVATRAFLADRPPQWKRRVRRYARAWSETTNRSPAVSWTTSRLLVEISWRGADVLETIASQRSNIESAASRHRVDPNLIRATIYEEQTHLYPGEGIAERFGIGDTVRLGQLTVGDHGTREQLLDPARNINAIERHLSTLQSQPLIDPRNPVASIATRYNRGSATSITPYGRRVSGYFDRFSSGVWP